MEHLTSKQKEILEIAIELFYKKGFADTSMRDIAEVMNVKAASLYSHIKSKEEILEWISEDVKDRFIEIYTKVNSEAYEPSEKFDLMVRNHLSSIFHNVKLYDVFFTNVYRLRVDFTQQNEYLKSIEEYINFAEGIISGYLKTINITDDETIELVTKFSMNTLNSVYRYIPERKFDVDKHADFLRHMLHYGVIGKR